MSQDFNLSTDISSGTVLAPDDPLLQLCRTWGVRREATETGDFLFDKEGPVPFCFSAMRLRATALLQAQHEAPDQPVDGSVGVWIGSRKQEAWCAVFPPLNGGAHADIAAALAAAGVVMGIDRQIADALDREDGFLRLAKIAAGVPAQNGENGYIIDLFEAPKDGLREGEQGKIDFKELNWIVNVSSGQQLCEIVPPTAGTDGHDVCGRLLRARPGRPAAIIAGRNTEYSADRRYLLASIDGHLTCTSSRYDVNDLLTIHSNVDYSTGNIRANGSVVIYGDIQPNFRVEAMTDIIVHGTVTGGTLIAGGDICVYGGVLASTGTHSELCANGDIRCKFMENGIAYAQKNAYFENLINSHVSCDGDIFVTSGRGSVIGGSLTAMGKITISMLGNRAYRPTTVKIGCTETFTENKEHLKEEIALAERKCALAEEGLKKLRAMPDCPQMEDLPQKLQSTLHISKMKLQNQKNIYDEMEKLEEAVYHGRVYVSKAFPNAVVKINGAALKLRDELSYCYFYLAKDGIHWSPR